MLDRKPVVSALLLFLALSLSAGIAAAQQSRDIQVGDSTTVAASVSNPLQVPDVLRVEFNGDAVSQGLVDVELPDEGSRLECNPDENACEVALEPGEERDVEFSITGMQAGTEEFMVSVSSDTTEKRSEASVQLNVESQEGEGFMDLLNRMLGII